MTKKFPTYTDLLIILALFFVFQIPFVGLVFIIKTKVLAMLIAYVSAMGMVIWITRRMYRRKSKLNFKPVHLKTLPIVIITTYAFFIVGNSMVNLLPQPTGLLKKMMDDISLILESPVYGFIMLAIAAPILEEILFRGIILKALLKKYQPWKAIIISAVFFGIFHLNPWQFVNATVFGIWLGYMYWKTKSLFYPVMIHFIANGTVFVLAQVFGTEIKDDPFAKNDIGILLLNIGFFMLVIWAAYRYFEKYFSTNPKPIVLATQNPHKIAEIQKILPASFVLQSLQDIGFKGKLRETGKTLQANALQKLRQISIPYDVDALADDTGLEVEALNGAPGVYSARYAGENVTYRDNVDKLLQEMQGVENRNAQFKTVVALSLGDKEHLVEGIVKGQITTEPRGEGGFGYDSVFVPEGYTQTFAQMSDEQKNAISHRAMALKKLKDILD